MEYERRDSNEEKRRHQNGSEGGHALRAGGRTLKEAAMKKIRTGIKAGTRYALAGGT